MIVKINYKQAQILVYTQKYLIRLKDNVMKNKLAAICLFFAGLFTPLLLSAQPLVSPTLSNTNTIAPILQRSMPAVVNIVATGKMQLVDDPFLRKQLEQNASPQNPSLQGMNFAKSGSGIIIDSAHGLVLTNAHMITQADSIVVNLNDGRKYLARLIGSDDDTDIAVLQINAKKLAALPIANSDTVKVGDFVAAIGNPFGLQQTVTSGIVSGLHRSNLNIEGLEDFIQTDAPINTGNSGGALINAQGQLVGMNTAILANDGGSVGIGFAIPSNMLTSVAKQILQYGKVNRGILGVLVQNLNPQLAQAFNVPENQGAIVTEVVPYSPAAEQGVKVGDIIIKVNGKTVQDNGEVRTIIGLLRIGDKVNLTLLRNGKTVQVSTVVANPNFSVMQAKINNPFLYGLTLRDVTEQTTNNAYVQGVYVVQVAPTSLAWSMGLKKGDVIVSANLKPVRNVKELQNIASHTKDHLLLHVIGDNGSYFILLQ